jgi:hypothetical protein
VGVGTDTAAAGSSLSLGSSFTNYPGGTAYWTFTGGDNYTNKTGNVPITISKRTVTATITGNNKEFDNNTNAVITPCALNTASGNVGVVATDNGNVTCGGTGQFANPNVGTWTVTGTIALSGSASGNYVLSSTSPTTTATIFVCDNAVTRYIGETLFITSGSSTTTAKVTLTASITDPTGLGLAGATVTFTDLLTNKVLAAGVPVSQVPGAPASGTANAIVTLSSGNYGSDSYLILVSLGGNYDNGTQPIVDKTATIVVSQPAAANTIKGGGTIQDTALTGVAGTYLSGLPVTYSVGLNYNNKLTNLQGQIKLTIPQADGSAIVIKSNSLSSMSVTTLPGINNKQATVYTKASISRINADLTTTAIEGGITLRFDVTDMNDDTLDAVGFTALSAKDSTLFYSNDWFFDAATSTWKTRAQTLSSGCIKVGGQ